MPDSSGVLAFFIATGLSIIRLKRVKTIRKQKRRQQRTIIATRVGADFLKEGNCEPSLFRHNDRSVAIQKPRLWASPKAPSTQALVCYDDRRLHFVFLVQDRQTFKDAANLCDNGKEWAKEQNMPQAMWSILNDDRMEAFLLPESSAHEENTYFAFEVNKAGRAIVSRTQFLRKFDFNWKTSHQKNCGGEDDALQVPAKITFDDGQQLVFRFSVDLADLKLSMEKLQDGTQSLRLLLARATRVDKTGADMAWSSWVDPCDDRVDFHRPETFGWVHFPL